LFYRPETCTVTAAVQTSLCYSPDCVTSSPAGSWWRNWGTEIQSQVNTSLGARQRGGPACQSADESRDSRNYEHATYTINSSSTESVWVLYAAHRCPGTTVGLLKITHYHLHVSGSQPGELGFASCSLALSSTCSKKRTFEDTCHRLSTGQMAFLPIVSKHWRKWLIQLTVGIKLKLHQVELHLTLFILKEVNK